MVGDILPHWFFSPSWTMSKSVIWNPAHWSGTLLRLYQYVLPPRGASLVPGVDHNKTTDYRHHEASQVIAAIDIFRFCWFFLLFWKTAHAYKFSAIFWPVALVTFSLLLQFYFFLLVKQSRGWITLFFHECVLNATFMVLLYKTDHKILVQELDSEGAGLLLLIFHSSKLGLSNRGRKVNNLLMLLCSPQFGIIEFHVNLWKCEQLILLFSNVATVLKKKASGFLFLYGREKEISVGILLDVNCFRDAGITFCQELSAIVEECSLVSWIMNKCQFECVLCC